MKSRIIIVLLLFSVLLVFVESKKLKLSKSRSSSSSRGSSSSRRTNTNPSPSSLSNPQAAAPKPQPSLFGWQEKPAQRTQPKQSQPTNTQSHSYPSSQTGLSGGTKAQQPANSYPSSQGGLSGGQQGASHASPGQQNAHKVNNNPSHSYPSSNTGLSGANSGASYPQQQGGLSGAGAAVPPAHGNNYHPQGQAPPYSQSGVGYPKQAPPPYSAGNYPNNNYGNNYHHPQGPPPPYSHPGGYGGHGGYGGYGGHGGYNPMHTPQMPGYFGNYGSNRGFGSVGRSGGVLKGVGIAGAGIGTVLTGLALWNLVRSTGRQHHTVIYDNRGQPVAVEPDNSTVSSIDTILGDLVNCTLTIDNGNSTEILAIPCAIATSFTPDADVKDGSVENSPNDITKCTVTAINKAGKEFMTTIPCSTLLNTAAENNVTEPSVPLESDTVTVNSTMNPVPDNASLSVSMKPEDVPEPLVYSTGLDNSSVKCSPESGDIRDPINPCFTVNGNLTVIPLPTTDVENFNTPSSA